MTSTNNALVKHNGGITGPGDAFRGLVSVPASFISEAGDAYYLSLDMPGARKDAIRVTVVEDTLSVLAPIARVHENDTKILYSELPSGSYERHFTLGRGIDRSSVDARYEDGVLTLTLRKTEAVRPKEIIIH